jgi:hypothetical protein
MQTTCRNAETAVETTRLCVQKDLRDGRIRVAAVLPSQRYAIDCEAYMYRRVGEIRHIRGHIFIAIVIGSLM